MPSNSQRVTAVATTAALVFMGAWLAQALQSSPAQAEKIGPEASPLPQKTARSAVLPVAQSINSESSLKVIINGVRNKNGKVYVAIFDNAGAFAKSDYQRAVDVKILNPSLQQMKVEFPNLSGDAYAVSIFHDENGNEQFDLKDGYPSEGYGTSRAKNAYDDPKYHQAVVKPGTVKVMMHYLM